MSEETCKLCNQDATPWVHINGHICQDCYANSKRLSTNPQYWTDVKDKLPPEEENVILYAPNEKDFFMPSCLMCIGYILPKIQRGKDWHGNEIMWFVTFTENDGFTKDQVTHWMPLPEPPICEK